MKVEVVEWPAQVYNMRFITAIQQKAPHSHIRRKAWY